MAELKIKGKLKQVLPIENGKSKAGKEWTKQSFVIDTGDQYNPDICFQLFGDKISLIHGLNLGDALDVFFNISSREYNGKYYHNIDAWRVERLSQSIEQVANKVDAAINPADLSKDEEDSLPF